MAPLPVISDCFRVTLNWECNSARAANVMHLNSVTLDETDLEGALVANFTNNMWAAQTNNAGIDAIDIIKLDGTSPTHHFTESHTANFAGHGGTGGPEFAPANIVTLYTATRGRSARGRLYLPFPDESKVSNGILDATTVTNVQSAWAAFVTAMASDGFTLVVASYLEGVARAVTQVKAQSVLGTIRRRQSQLR